MKDGLRDKNVERLFVDQKPTKDTSPAAVMTFVFFFSSFLLEEFRLGDLLGRLHDKKSFAQ